MPRWTSSRSKRRTAIEEPGLMPVAIEPQLAAVAKQVPSHGDWSWELKYE